MGDDGGDGGNGTQCPFSATMADGKDIMSLRAVRDLLQAKDEQLVAGYYQHAFEVSAILRNSPQLRREFQELTLSNLGVAQELAAGGHATIDRQSLREILAFLEKLQGKASLSLRQSLRIIADDMQEEGFLRKLGIQIAE
jgi:hypothetical protein